MNTCEYYHELISRMLDDELTKQERLVLAEHLSICSECATMYSAFSMLSDAVASDLVEPPEELTEDVMAHIRRAEMRRRNQEYNRARRSAQRQMRNLVAAAASIAVMIAAVGGVALVNSRRSQNAVYESRLRRDTASGTTAEDGLFDSTILAPEPEVTQAPVQESKTVTEDVQSDSWLSAAQSWWGSNDGWFSTPEPTPVPQQSVPEIAPPGLNTVVTPAPTPFIPSVFESAEAPLVVVSPAVTQAPVIVEAPIVIEAPAAPESHAAPEIPATAQLPETIDSPFTTQSPVIVEAPVVTESPMAAEFAAPTETPVTPDFAAIAQLPMIAEFTAPDQAPKIAEAPVQEESAVFEAPAEFEEFPAVEDSQVQEESPIDEQAPAAEITHIPSVFHDFSQMDCSDFISTIFGFDKAAESEAGNESESHAAAPVESSEQYISFIDRVLAENAITLCSLPEGIQPDRVESAAFCQDGLYFLVQLEVYGEQLYVFTYDGQGQQVCFQTGMSVEEYDAFVQNCYSVSESE